MVSPTTIITVEFLLLACICALLVRHYAQKGVTLDVRVTVFLSWLLGFAGILLLPYDISQALGQQQDGDTAPAPSAPRHMLPLTHAWDFIYWSTFVLAWVVLPVQDAYHASGHFTPRDKLAEALRKNLYFYLACLAAGAAYVGYALVTRRGSPRQVTLSRTLTVPINLPLPLPLF